MDSLREGRYGKLDEASVWLARWLDGLGMPRPEIAAKFGLQTASMSPILTKGMTWSTWQHVSYPEPIIDIPRPPIRRGHNWRTLTEEAVIECRYLYAQGAKASDLMLEFGVRRSAFYSMVTPGKVWSSWVDVPYPAVIRPGKGHPADHQPLPV
jgi:hypothetical protein